MEIELRHITKSFGRVRALSGVSAQLKKGELLLITGPNGSGKSTLLRILATALVPDSGEYSWNGRLVHQALKEARQAIGFLDGEQNALYEDLSALDNLNFWGCVYANHSMQDLGGRIGDILRQWDLWDQRSRPVQTLSQGMKKRLGLARLAAQGSSLLLLDEPFNGLDAQNAGVLQNLLAQWKAEGKAIAIATHQPQILSGLPTHHLELRN